MDSSRFDPLTRRVGSRRVLTLGIGAASLLTLTDAATAKKNNRKDCKRPAIRLRCSGNTCGKQKFKKGCFKKTLNCTCRGDQICMSNKSCGVACPAECPQDGGSCSCPESGDQFCVRDDLSCELTPKTCATLADCPTGLACVETACGPEGAAEKRCVPVCHPAP